MRVRKRTVVVLASVVVLVVLGLGAGLALLVLHEPGYYARCEVAPGAERLELSKKCVGTIFSMAGNIAGGAPEWAGEITHEQLNSMFAEDFMKWGEAESLRRVGITKPRIIFEQDRMRLAFRYGTGVFSTVISLDIKVWLAPQDTNVVAVEFLGRYAGSLPISAHALLEVLSAQAREQNTEVTWYRHNGNPVALVRFQANRLRPTFQLHRLELLDGKIAIAGKNVPEASTY
ncbi:MAG: hypothetical protein FJ271_00365 [Planctomycetes bacterium]|nr:hypothetical protein [Planctomycetota bacterium]